MSQTRETGQPIHLIFLIQSMLSRTYTTISSQESSLHVCLYGLLYMDARHSTSYHCGTFCIFQSSRLILKSVEVNLYTDYCQLISLLDYLKYKPWTGCINLCMFSVCMSVCVAINVCFYVYFFYVYFCYFFL